MVKFQNLSLSNFAIGGGPPARARGRSSWRTERQASEGYPAPSWGLGELSAPSTDRAVQRLWLTCLEVPVCALLVPWPWRINKKSSEPDTAVSGRSEQLLTHWGKCLVVKKKKKGK